MAPLLFWMGRIVIGVCDKHMDGESLNLYREVYMCNQVFAVTTITGDNIYVSNACLIASQLLYPPQHYLVVLSSPSQIHNQRTLSCIWLVRKSSNHNLRAHLQLSSVLCNSMILCNKEDLTLALAWGTPYSWVVVFTKRVATIVLYQHPHFIIM